MLLNSLPAERPVHALMVHHGKLSFIRGSLALTDHYVARTSGPNPSGLINPFRHQLVCLVSDLIRDGLGLKVEPPVSFDAWSPPEEDAELVLLVTFFVPKTADLSAVRALVFGKIAEWSRFWNPEQKQDFRKHVYIDIDSLDSRLTDK